MPQFLGQLVNTAGKVYNLGMKAWFTRWFVTDDKNGGSPKIFGASALLGFTIITVIMHSWVLTSLVYLSPHSKYFADILSNVLVDLTNERRSAEKIGELQINPLLVKAAQMKADDMASRGYFSHVSPDGKTPWYWLQQVGYAYTYAGENLAVNFFDSEDVMNAWMNSPSHRANVENGKYTQIGIATAHGTYDGRTGIYVVQFFGRPTAPKTGLTPTAPTKTTPSKTIVKEPTVKTNTIKNSRTVQPAANDKIVSPNKQAVSVVETGSSGLAEASKATEGDLGSNGTVSGLDETSTFPAGLADNQGATNKLVGSLEKLLVLPDKIARSMYIIMGALFCLAAFLHFLLAARGTHRTVAVNGTVMLLMVLTALFIDKLVVIVQAQVR